MTNKDLVNAWIKGEGEYALAPHACYVLDFLFNYDTIIAYIDRENEIAFVNVGRYSNSTTNLQHIICERLSGKGYGIEKFGEGVKHGGYSTDYLGYNFDTRYIRECLQKVKPFYAGEACLSFKNEGFYIEPRI